MNEVTEEKRAMYLDACPAWGVGEDGGAGYDASTVECQLCEKEAAEMAAACKAEVLPDRDTTPAVEETERDIRQEIQDERQGETPPEEAEETAGEPETQQEQPVEAPPEEETAEEQPADTAPAQPKAKKGPRKRKWDKICHPNSQAGLLLDLLKDGRHTMKELIEALRGGYPQQLPSDKQAQSWINRRMRNWKKRGYFTVEKAEDGKLTAVPPAKL